MIVQGHDPRTGSPVGDGVPETTPQELEARLAAAAEAFETLRATSPKARAELLSLLADRLDARAEELIPLAVAESGLPTARLTGELARTSAQLRLIAGVVTDGASVLVKAHPSHPALSQAVASVAASAVHDAGLPSGVFGIIFGD